MPSTRGISADPIVSVQLQEPRHRSPSDLLRHSNETPRMISATRSSITARYPAENQVAYQAGKAAKIAAPPTISQTSLPSHSGPTLPSTARRSASVRPTDRCSMPTPKSKPSSTKNPVQKNPTITNHSHLEAHQYTSDASAGVGVEEPGPSSASDGSRSGSSGRLAKRSIRMAHTMPSARYRTTKVPRLSGDLGQADGGRVRVLREQQSLHDPRLAAVLGQQPARGVHRERREEGEGADPEEARRREQPAPPPQEAAPQGEDRQDRSRGRPSPASTSTG